MESHPLSFICGFYSILHIHQTQILCVASSPTLPSQKSKAQQKQNLAYENFFLWAANFNKRRLQGKEKEIFQQYKQLYWNTQHFYFQKSFYHPSLEFPLATLFHAAPPALCHGTNSMLPVWRLVLPRTPNSFY